MKKQIQEILRTCPKNARKKHLTSEMIQWLADNYDTTDFSYQCELALDDGPIPTCAVCGKLPARNKKTCSAVCREKLKKQLGQDSFAKSRNTMVERYGVDNPAKLVSVQHKRLQTLKNRYGAGNSQIARHLASQRADVSLNQKGRSTIQKKYGVSNPGQMSDHQQKVKKTNLQKYGCENYFNSDVWKMIQEKKEFERLLVMVGETSSIISIDDAEEPIKNTYNNPNRRVTIQCNKCKTVETIPTETLKFRLRTFTLPCKVCSHIDSNSSAAEKQIAKWLNDSTNFQIIRNDRSIIAPYELDIVIPEKMIAIEYCGLYWHNDKRIDKKYHFRKHQACVDKGYSLITIFEDEWIHKSDIVKNRLCAKLGLHYKTIHTRKCVVEELSTQEARSFIHANHVQGYHNSSVRLGLKYNGQLVSVMTFRLGDASKRQTGWELSRFCNIPGVSIPGAASKLFKYFVSNFSPQTVTTFSDLRWNTGDVYVKMGFNYVGHSGLNYWYIKGSKRIHRFQLCKQPDESKELTERELREQQGWNRIWDCGNAKYTWTNPDTAQ